MLLIYIYSVGIMCQCLKILLFLLSFLLEITYKPFMQEHSELQENFRILKCTAKVENC